MDSITKARQEKLDKVFSMIKELLYKDDETLSYESVSEFLTSEGKLNFQYINQEYLNIMITNKIFQSKVKKYFGKTNFLEKATIAEPLPKVSKEEFMEFYTPAKYINQRRWINFWHFRGKSLDITEAFGWILETSKPKKVGAYA